MHGFYDRYDRVAFVVTQGEYIEIQPMIEYIDEMKHIVYRGESCVEAAAAAVVMVRSPWESSGGQGPKVARVVYNDGK